MHVLCCKSEWFDWGVALYSDKDKNEAPLYTDPFHLGMADHECSKSRYVEVPG